MAALFKERCNFCQDRLQLWFRVVFVNKHAACGELVGDWLVGAFEGKHIRRYQGNIIKAGLADRSRWSGYSVGE